MTKNLVRTEDTAWVIKGTLPGTNATVKIGLMERTVKVSEIVPKWTFNAIGRYVGNYCKQFRSTRSAKRKQKFIILMLSSAILSPGYEVVIPWYKLGELGGGVCIKMCGLKDILVISIDKTGMNSRVIYIYMNFWKRIFRFQ